LADETASSISAAVSILVMLLSVRIIFFPYGA
jgi:hypothetical protein